jgi:hypothetical protein
MRWLLLGNQDLNMYVLRKKGEFLLLYQLIDFQKIYQDSQIDISIPSQTQRIPSAVPHNCPKRVLIPAL